MSGIKLKTIGIVVVLVAITVSCQKGVVIESGHSRLEVNRQMETSIHTGLTDKVVLKQPQQSEYLVSGYSVINQFRLDKVTSTPTEDSRGKGVVTRITGHEKKYNSDILKIVNISVYDKYPDVFFFNVQYVNRNSDSLVVDKWVNQSYNVASASDKPSFWSFQGSSTSARGDWVKPIKQGFHQQNFMGMNQTDYGGGIPVVSLWRKDICFTIGHSEPVPLRVSLPVDLNKGDDYACINVSFDREPVVLQAGDTLTLPETFVMLSKGDYFAALRTYSTFMADKGIKMAPSEESAFEPMWCAWGYERNFTVDEILGTLPKVKELGIKWVVVDDGYQIAEGDWSLNKRAFPGGDRQMKQLINKIHSYGLKAQIWWAPLAADPQSELYMNNPDMILRHSDYSPSYITWWDSFLLSPENKKTIAHTKEVVNQFMGEWGFDGLKLDGQHMNAIPPDFTTDHPYESPKLLPRFFKGIYEQARNLNNNAVIQFCPCGECLSFFNLPNMNQAVASDPVSSWQIRLKGKTIKALDPGIAYFGDHVELSDNGNDFASSFGVGAVLGTKFTWPENNPDVKEDYRLTPEKEKIWKKWFSLYNNMMLSKGEYLGSLYDIGYDKPETHVIRKENDLYYAFYAENWDGKIELRGLKPRCSYKVEDYYSNRELGNISGDNPVIDVSFKKFLLIKTSKIK